MTKIKIDKLWLDINILNIVQESGYIWPDDLEQNIDPTIKLLPLNKDRLCSIINIYKNIEPIKVKKRVTGMYDIIDGRHRVSASIILGCDFIDFVEI